MAAEPLGLQLAARRSGARVSVVDERHTVAHEDVVLDGHALTDEGVTRDLTVLTDLRVLLNLHERADLGVVAHLAAVEIDEFPQLDALAQPHVGSDALIVVHS